MNLLKLLINESEKDKKLKTLIKNTYKSVRVVGLSTIRIDASEIANDTQFKADKKRFKSLVK